ncbi:ArsR/SmtB family transcription factor [Methylobacterium sp. A54F]
MLNEFDALTMLIALAQESRLHIVRTLLHESPEGMAAGRIAEVSACAASTVSFHLQHLEKAGLIRSLRQGQSIIYFAVPNSVAALSVFLNEAGSGGAPLPRAVPGPKRARAAGRAYREPAGRTGEG